MDYLLNKRGRPNNPGLLNKEGLLNKHGLLNKEVLLNEGGSLNKQRLLNTLGLLTIGAATKPYNSARNLTTVFHMDSSTRYV